MRIFEKPVKLYIIGKVLLRAVIQKYEFYQIKEIASKVMGFKVNFGLFTTNIHQIRLSHVTPDANFENL